MADASIPAPGAHGGDGIALARALGIAVDAVLDLSVSLNPLAPDPAPLVAAAAGAVRHYPDARPATNALAAAIGVDRSRVILTNGGAEAIALVAAHCPTGRVDDPEFSLYARHLREVTPDGPRWRSNPHNPTGRLADRDESASIWDEAFYPLATGTWTRGDGGATVVGSLTKLFACPGLRLGYVIAPDAATATAMRARQPEWSVGSVACAAVPALLATADLSAWSDGIAKLRHELVEILAAAGLVAEDGDASFVLVRHAPGVRERLARRAVLVRDTESFGIPGGVRIAVPDTAGLERLADALSERAC
jgi:histidinol-phosphate/aromatic aminotransferase/cobyric acid decarboxylase-like protein